MKRSFALALIFGVVFALLAVAPASAQYGPPPPPPPEEPPPSGCPAVDPPPEDPPPCHPRERASVSDSTVQPGQTITVTTPEVFAPDSEVTIYLVRVRRGADADALATPTTDADGSVEANATIPADADRGVYFLYVEGLDAEGNRVVAITTVVVLPAVSAAAQSASVEGDFTAASAPTPVPPAVAEVQTDLPPKAEAAVVDAVETGKAGVVLSPTGELNVRTPEGTTQAASALAATGNDISTQVTAGAALVLAGTGFVLLRRRKVAHR